MKIIIETIPVSQQRYSTLGDYFYNQEDYETLHIKISETGIAEHDLLLAIHELVEFTITRANGVSIADIDKFDRAHPEAEEPGDLPGCPYGFEHSTATGIERVVAAACGTRWSAYEENLGWIMGHGKSDA